jgi:hypothetical protein
VPASRRMGVHAPDIKEEFKEFKEFEEFEEFWRGPFWSVQLLARKVPNGTNETKFGRARLPNDLVIGPKHLMASCRMLSISRKTRRAVVERCITARRAFRHIGIV